MDWKKTVEEAKPQSLWFEVNDRMIHAHRWMNEGVCTVVFIHGSMSNNVWWQPIAASLTKGVVLSIDLSGHGLSEWSETYTVERHAQEVASLITQFGKGRVYVIGHSYGGYVAGYLATLLPVEKLILVDTPLHFEKREIAVRSRMNSYLTLEDAVDRFKPLPAQPCADLALLKWIAKRSIKKVAGRYTWQFDPNTLNREFPSEVVDIIKKGLKGNGAWWYGELSPFATLEAKQVAKSLHLEIEMIEGAYHAVMIDAPLVLSQKIKKLIGDKK